MEFRKMKGFTVTSVKTSAEDLILNIVKFYEA
uniref:Uncharacterized protein n=1 Tax=Saccharolobus solfataricus (strain 98/2) TaxID=555311 RepID=D0KUU9_SACS9